MNVKVENVHIYMCIIYIIYIIFKSKCFSTDCFDDKFTKITQLFYILYADKLHKIESIDGFFSNNKFCTKDISTQNKTRFQYRRTN